MPGPKVGDRIEVMVNNVGMTSEIKGAILTVTKECGFYLGYPDIFATTTTINLGTRLEWWFELNNINEGSVKVLPPLKGNTNNNTMTLKGGSINFAPVNITISCKTHNCECGAHAVKDQFHSTWCPEHVPMWKNR